MGTTNYAPVWIANAGTVDAIGVSVVKDSAVPVDGNSLRVKWNLSEDEPGGGDYTIQFGWSPALESTGFKADRENKARIFNLTDTTEAGTGGYTMQFTSSPYTLSRGGISELGPFGIGVYEELTGVFENSDDIPGEFTLYQNYPNPFRNVTTFKFEVPEKTFVHLKIFNLVGEEITDLAGKEYDPGVYSVSFDASHLNAGIYFYSIRMNDLVQTRKMTLMK